MLSRELPRILVALAPPPLTRALPRTPCELPRTPCGLPRTPPLCATTLAIGRESSELARTECVSLIDFCIAQLKAQGPSRTCNESKEEEECASGSKEQRARGRMTQNDGHDLDLSGRCRALGLGRLLLARSLRVRVVRVGRCLRRRHTLTHSHSHSHSHTHTHTLTHSHTDLRRRLRRRRRCLAQPPRLRAERDIY